MTEDRIAQIEQAIAEAEEQGLPWTNRTIFAQIGGKYESLAEYLKTRRAQSRAEAITAVDVEDEEPEGPAPLSEARLKRDETAALEYTLALREQDVKRERHALENQANQLMIQQQTVRSDSADLARRRQVQSVSRQLTAVEAERQQVHQQRRAAGEAKIAAQDAYEVLAGQARRWLRRLRQAQRESQTSASAFHRGESREELGQVLAQLAQLLGRTEAQTLADDATRHPDWLKD